MISLARLCPQTSSGSGCSTAEHKDQTQPWQLLRRPWSGDGSAGSPGDAHRVHFCLCVFPLPFLPLPVSPCVHTSTRQPLVLLGSAGTALLGLPRSSFLRLRRKTGIIPTSVGSWESVGLEELWGLAAPPQGPSVRPPGPNAPGDPLSSTPQ